MALKVLFFGVLQECTGCKELELAAEAHPTLQHAQQALLKRYPCLEKRTYRMSCNAQFADGERPLADGDELAFLPPFSGG